MKVRMNSDLLLDAIEWNGKNIFEIIDFIDGCKDYGIVRTVNLYVPAIQLILLTANPDKRIELQINEILIKNINKHPSLERYTKEEFLNNYSIHQMDL